MADAMRADGRRNYEHVLEVARAAFAEQGTDISLREVARRAGVGIGTLYRHFPTREALIEAALRQGLDALCARAQDLSAAESPVEALGAWLHDLAISSTRYQGLPASLFAALQDEESELHRSCRAMSSAAALLLRRAQEAGQVRADIAVGDLLALTAGIAWAGQQTADADAATGRLLRLIRTGIELPVEA